MANSSADNSTMIPGELLPAEGDIELNAGRATVTLAVANSGDRPIQVGSHFHFYEVNDALQFERDQAKGMRLDIPAGRSEERRVGIESRSRWSLYHYTRTIGVIG